MKIVIVDDHLMFREAVRKACTRDFGHIVVGETDLGATAIEMILRLKPDAVILDLSLPDMEGFDVAEKVLSGIPTLKILVLSSHCDDYTLFRVEKIGVNGFIDKNTNTIAALRDALTALKEGRSYFSPVFQEAKLLRRTDPNSFAKVLTEWECAILSLIGQGLTDEEIGEKLSISSRTAQTHRSNIMRKLNMKGTPKLIAFAIEHGFTRAPAKRGSTPTLS
ncbi:MAG TPA: response regulator transcription factor [Opitutaceae bacterium]|nr:response regulator transcription factor [Opitutaceae bacterium]